MYSDEIKMRFLRKEGRFQGLELFPEDAVDWRHHVGLTLRSRGGISWISTWVSCRLDMGQFWGQSIKRTMQNACPQMSMWEESWLRSKSLKDFWWWVKIASTTVVETSSYKNCAVRVRYSGRQAGLVV